MQRKLSPILIDHDTLTQTLQDIQSQLQQQHPDFTLVHKHPRYYYQSSKVLYAGQVEQILIVVEIPIASTTTRFNLYHVLTFPVPFNDSSADGTLITNLPDFVAISTDKRFVIEIPSSQMALCHGRHSIFCPDKFPHKPFSTPSCVTAMFQKTKVKENCHFQFQESVIVPSILELDEGTLLLTHIPELIFTCHNVVTKKPGCSFCLLKLPCFCSVLAGDFSFSPRLASCQDTSAVTMVPSPGINLALLQHFFNDSSVAETNADKWYLSKVPYSIPPLRIASSDSFQQHAKTDQKLRMSLRDVTNHMKTGKAVYRSAMDAFMLQGQFEDDSQQWQWSHVLAYISFGLTIVLCVVVFIMCQKLRTLLTIIAVAQAPVARAAYPTLTWPDPNLPQADTNPAQASSTDTAFSLDSLTPVDHSVVSTQAFICVLLITVIVIHIKLIFRSMNYTSEVMLEVCSHTLRVNVFLCSVAKCPGDYCIPITTWIRSLSVKPLYHLWGELHLNWPQLTLKDRRTGQIIAIPKVVKLSMYETYKLKKMLEEDYTVFIKIKHGDTATYLRKPNSDCHAIQSPPSLDPNDQPTSDSAVEPLYPRLHHNTQPSAD